MKVTKAVIPAAGFGTRFLPATKAVPKEMLPIVDKPTIQYIVEEAIASGIEDLLIITSRGKDALVNHFDRAYELETILERDGKQEMLNAVREVSDKINVQFVRQKEQKGLGHAVLCAKSFVGNEPFAVMLGDDVVVAEKPCLSQLIEQFNKYNATVLGVQKVGMDQVSKYGIVDCDNVEGRMYKLKGMVEKPKKEDAPSDVAVLGRYVITPAIFDCLEKTPKGAGGEIQLTDALVMLAKNEDMYAYDFEGRRYDIGSKQGFLQATVDFALSRDDLKDEFAEYLKEVTRKALDCIQEKNVDIEEYKQKNLEPGAVEIRVSYQLLGIDEYDRSTVSRKALVKFLRGRYGSTSYEISQGEIRISCSDKNISISERSITWERYVTLLDQYCPKEEKEEPEPVERKEEQRDMVSEIETEDTDCKEPAGKPDREGREVSVSMDELVEEGREETAGLTRQEYMNSLDIKGVSSYISHFLSEEILRCPALIEKWLKDCVNEEGQSV